VTCDDAPEPMNDTITLERARNDWQLGEWEHLAELDPEGLEHHPDRAKLALLAAAAQLETGNVEVGRHLVDLAKQWGCEVRSLRRMLVATLHGSLGRAHLARNDDGRAKEHFRAAIRTVLPDVDIDLAGELRAVREATRMGLLPQATRIVSAQLDDAHSTRTKTEARLAILASEVELLRQELSLAQQRNQLYSARNRRGPVADLGSDLGRAQLAQRSVSQLGQDLWVLERTGYKSGGFFVEFGATDGVLLSNTWLLEKEFGWRGICAEPNPKLFEALRRNRTCTVSDQFIGRVTGEHVDFVLADAYGGAVEYASADINAATREPYLTAGHVTAFTSISLHDFLRQHGAPRDIDYISIDTEGNEYDVLSTFPFNEWNVTLFTVEHNFTEQRTLIRQLLESHGYRCTEQRWDDWYERE
jgi:FkbM family methyltransferase